MTSDRGDAGLPSTRPGLTACSLCAGETLGDGDTLEGGQLSRLRRLADTGLARLTLSECLDECNRGDVVVVRPSGPARRCGARPVWFEQLAGEELTSALSDWLRAGGAGVAPLPGSLRAHVVDRGVTEPAADVGQAD